MVVTLVKYVCPCQDSIGVVCGKVITYGEHKQDGMCQTCADHVWAALRAPWDKPYHWTHGS